MIERDILQLRGMQEVVYAIEGPDGKIIGMPRLTQEFGKGQDETDRFKAEITFRKNVSENVYDTRTVKATGKTPREILMKLESAYRDYYAGQDD